MMPLEGVQYLFPLVLIRLLFQKIASLCSAFYFSNNLLYFVISSQIMEPREFSQFFLQGRGVAPFCYGEKKRTVAITAELFTATIQNILSQTHPYCWFPYNQTGAQLYICPRMYSENTLEARVVTQGHAQYKKTCYSSTIMCLDVQLKPLGKHALLCVVGCVVVALWCCKSGQPFRSHFELYTRGLVLSASSYLHLFRC